MERTWPQDWESRNYLLFGHIVPHLHVHIVPRYLDDSAPERPLPWLNGEAKLESVEPGVMVRIVGGSETGRMQLRVEMTPDNVAQGHWFEQEIDQSISQRQSRLARRSLSDIRSATVRSAVPK